MKEMVTKDKIFILTSGKILVVSYLRNIRKQCSIDLWVISCSLEYSEGLLLCLIYAFNLRGEPTEVSVCRFAKAEKIRLESFKLTFKDHLAFPRHTGTNRNPVPNT